MSPIQGLSGFGGGATSKLLGGAGGAGGGSSFTFDYHMYGANIGDLEVYVYNTGTSSLIGPLSMTYDDGNATGTVISGQQQTASNQVYKNAVVDLSPASGVTGYLAFKYRPQAGYRADAAVDSMALTLPDETVVDLDPDLFRSSSINNWERTQITNQTDNSFPSTWSACQKVTNVMGSYEDGSTGSGSTGPSGDADGSTVGYYIYWETSGSFYTYTGWVRYDTETTF